VDVAGHGARGLFAIAGQERFDDCQVLAGFLGQSVIIISRLIAFPRQVAEGAKEDLQPADFFGQEGIAAGLGDQIVQSAIDRASLLEKSRRAAFEGH
jgi:hypothetical protein